MSHMNIDHDHVLCAGLAELQAELEKDIDKELISTMCVRKENDIIELKCFLSATSLLKFANHFQLIGGETHCSEIFFGFWRRTLYEAITDNPQLSLSDIYASVWQPCIGRCRNLLESLENQSIKLSDVDTDLKPYCDRLDTQLGLLHKSMANITRKSGNLYLINEAAQRVREYWNLCHYQRSANTFLELKKTLGLTTGDFILVEKLSQQV
ncbi:MAG: hypothetical protein MJE68_24830 [Proteobacteria bacterium]|nr:hypothetical protein [Pseudomonadota bacterium]